MKPVARPSTTALLSQTLVSQRVLGLLGASERKALARQWHQQQVTKGSIFLAQGQLADHTCLLLSGTVQLQDPDLGLKVQLQAGELFGWGATAQAQLLTWQALAQTDCTLATLAREQLAALCLAHPELGYFFPSFNLAEVEGSVGSPASASANLLNLPLQSLIKRPPVVLPPGTSIQQTAQTMHRERVSSVLLMEQDKLFGLVTDRDLRNRAVAAGLPIERPVADIATLAAFTLDTRQTVFEALMMMARHNIHHIPVLDGQRIVGMITEADLTNQHSASAVYLVSSIYKKTSLDELVKISARIKLLQQYLAAADASAYSTGHIITAVTDALTVRLIQLAQARLGPAPIEFAWVAAGSQARCEQSAKSDQDNCLLLDDHYDTALHGDYFRDLSHFVCDGLDACGYIHCPGEMMAMTDSWRQPRQRWWEYFQRWINVPEPKALMLTSVFFDLRCVYGESNLLSGLQAQVLELTRGNTLFLAYMVSNALKHRPPLGMFGNISLTHSDSGPGTIDLKHAGTVPVIDLARVFALSAANTSVNTQDRLERAPLSGEVSSQSARDLRDALEFLSKLRISHQARQTERGLPADNFLTLDELSNFERSQLKQAFAVVQTVQSAIGQRYQSGRL